MKYKSEVGSAKLATVGIGPNAFDITTIIQDYETGRAFGYSVQNLTNDTSEATEIHMTAVYD